MGKKEDLINTVLEQAKEVEGRKRLTCAEAFELARQFQAEIIDIGRICNQHDIKICKCQLGCFP
ncbi:MAG: hypothetical protein ACETVZ_05040 [Phycisphaerae bacterium]